MLRAKIFILTVMMVATQWCAAPSAEAGPLLDWIRGLRRNRCNYVAPVNYRTTSYNAAANPHNLQPGQCARTCNQTCSRVVVNYVPYTAYRTNWKRVPVTQYRPQTSSDPCTGCTVTCMRPCTTYNWQMQRVPYTTYRPVYRTESYSVPVTTITNDCATGTCGTSAVNTCATCPTPGYSYPAGNLPQSSSVLNAPNGTLGANGQYQTVPGSGVPQYNPNTGTTADSVPYIDSNANPQNLQRPVIDRIETLPEESSTRNQPHQRATPAAAPNNIYPIQQPSQPTPAVINFGNQTAANPIRKKWQYQVQLASYTSTVDPEPSASTGPVSVQGTFVPTRQKQTQSVRPKKPVNSAWKSVDW